MSRKLAFIFLFITLNIFMLNAYGQAPSETIVDGYFYYYNPCESCDEEKTFHDIVDEQLKALPGNIRYSFTVRNVFKENIYEGYSAMCDKLGVPAENRNMPLLIINEKYAVGYDEIKTNVVNLVLDAACVIGKGIQDVPSSDSPYVDSHTSDSHVGDSYTVDSHADDSHADDSYIGSSHTSDPEQETKVPRISKNESHIVYFYTLSCNNCEKVKGFLDKLDKTINIPVGGRTIKSPVTIETYNIIHDYEKINTYFEKYNVPEKDRKVPILFYSEGYLSGYEDISEKLPGIITRGDALGFSYPQHKSSEEGIKTKDLPAIALTGFINGLNPCSASMLFMLLSLIAAQNVSVIKLGLAYVSGKAVAYFAIGSFFFSMFSFLNSKVFFSVQRWINIIIIIAAVVFALLNFFDFLSAKSEKYNKIRLQLPEGVRRFNHKLIKKVCSPEYGKYLVLAVFMLGIFISAGEFLCTGQVFIAAIIYLVKTSSSYEPITFIAFAIYIFMMIVPYIILIIAADRSKKIYLVSEWVRKNMPAIKLANFILFAIFAAYMLVMM